MEGNWPMIVLLMGAAAFSAYIGRWGFRRWLNPLTVYSAVWGLSLISFELRLIQYYPISLTASTYIALAWFSFILGTGTAFAIGIPKNRSGAPVLTVDVGRLRAAIFILCAIAAVTVIDQALVLRREFGSVWTAIFLDPGDIYLGRTNGEFSFFPYVGAFLFAASSMSGVYSAKRGRISLLSLLPLVLEVLNATMGMARGGVLIAGFLFAVSFLFTPKTSGNVVPKWQLVSGVFLVVMLLVGELAFVSTTRHLQTDFSGRTDALDKLSEYIPPLPSLYTNISATPVAFSMYLDTPDEQKTGFWGMNTFAPFYRLLAKLGFPTAVAGYEENYYTPVPMNTSTYLKDVHSDFGLPGIAIFPYLLGLVSAYLGLRIAYGPRLVDIVLLSHFMLVIAASFAINLMFTGDWPISVLSGVVGASIVERLNPRKNAPDLNASIATN
jgi:oligosaccharide repeat unit polymerase